MTYRLGEFAFDLKREAREHFSTMLKRTPVGAVTNATDALLLAALLREHPGASVKIGPGIAGFGVRLDGWGKRCFEVRRVDGSTVAFSFVSCFAGAPPIRSQIMGALRHVVAPDIVAARNAYLDTADRKLICAATGQPLAIDDAHLDHRHPLPFITLFEHFEAFGIHRRLRYDAMLEPPRHEAEKPRIVDTEASTAFRRFHWQFARLDFVERRVNLQNSATPRTAAPHIILREWTACPT